MWIHRQTYKYCAFIFYFFRFSLPHVVLWFCFFIYSVKLKGSSMPCSRFQIATEVPRRNACPQVQFCTTSLCLFKTRNEFACVWNMCHAQLFNSWWHSFLPFRAATIFTCGYTCECYVLEAATTAIMETLGTLTPRRREAACALLEVKFVTIVACVILAWINDHSHHRNVRYGLCIRLARVPKRTPGRRTLL